MVGRKPAAGGRRGARCGDDVRDPGRGTNALSRHHRRSSHRTGGLDSTQAKRGDAILQELVRRRIAVGVGGQDDRAAAWADAGRLRDAWRRVSDHAARDRRCRERDRERAASAGGSCNGGGCAGGGAWGRCGSAAGLAVEFPTSIPVRLELRWGTREFRRIGAGRGLRGGSGLRPCVVRAGGRIR